MLSAFKQSWVWILLPAVAAAPAHPVTPLDICVPGLTHHAKPPMLLPASRICKQLKATGEGHGPNSSLNAFWTWPPFALFDVVDVPHKVLRV